jgi:hypothetical protein
MSVHGIGEDVIELAVHVDIAVVAGQGGQVGAGSGGSWRGCRGHHKKSPKFIWIYMPHTLGKKVYQNKCSRDGLIWSGYYV